MAAKSQDKILFGIALVFLLASAGWALLQTSKLSELRNSANVGGALSAYNPAGIDAPRVSTKVWPQPLAQTRGAEWIYDVFTPPEIYYDATTRQFSVTPPVTNSAILKEPVPFGVELVSIKQDIFRLQLVGYIGGEGDYRGNFENALSGETIIGRAGKEFKDLGLKLKNFQVKRNVIKSPDSMDTIDIEAIAVLVDTKTGVETTLTNKRRLVKGTPIVILKETVSGNTLELKAESIFVIGDATYTVLSATAEPASVVITKTSPALGEPDTKTLTLSAPVDGILVPIDAAPASPVGELPFQTGN
jgi:hypothetical protein